MTGEEDEFEDRLTAAFGRAAVGLTPDGPVRLVDGAIAAGRRRRRGRRRAVLLAGALTLLVAAGASALSLPAGVPGRTSEALVGASSGAPAPLDHGVTVLLIGLDSTTDTHGRPAPDELRRGALHAGVRAEGDVADTLMLVHIPAGGGTVRQLSIPRDVLVDAGGGEQVRIGQVYLRAETAEAARLRSQGVTGADLVWRGREAGRTALIRAVQQLAGVPVDHFAELSMAGFYRVAQAVGPVPVCLVRAVDDQWSGAHLPAGRSELDPAQALAFVRQRHGVGDGSDLVRTHRAQALLAGVLQKLRAGGVLADAAKLGALYGALKEDLVVDQGWSPVDFLRQVPAFADGRTTATTLPVLAKGPDLVVDQTRAEGLLTGPATAPPSSPVLDEASCVE
ncbi:LCP family protein [Kitasatospora sp. MMS16-BH015]|uniref:LCP family protein n=1 Tax=Kitasatospora sp. MMS16-BH015 TaxID=2018025 RepID=UPI00131A549F|nr:LCP family protein [Kitasatospora sp. MMS16-BH015]